MSFRGLPAQALIVTALVLAVPSSLAVTLPAGNVAAEAGQLPTPGVSCDLSEATTGRIFPEPMETNDFIGFREAECGFQYLAENHADRVRVHVVSESFGWTNRVTGEHDRFPVYLVEVSNFESAFTDEEKLKIVFQLSIHGNEKGGREGGMRVLEDLARDMGMAAEHPELVDMLDYMMLVFIFVNPDGWIHEEAEYRANDACYVSATCATGGEAGEVGLETQNFVRVNGNGVDLNREWPTVGWIHEPYTALSEPEIPPLIDRLHNYTNVAYATDIHGMLTPADAVFPLVGGATSGPATGGGGGAKNEARGHYVLTMLPAGRQDPEEMLKTTALGALVKERLNNDDYFAEWHVVPESFGVWGGEFNEWGTVWDTLSYTDSGFTSDWYAQDHGLNAPGVDFELSYNHITFDNYYPGLTQRMNAYHVEAVREIVRAFMDHASHDIELSIETHGARTAYLENPKVFTNANDMTVSGWAAENPNDDKFDNAHREWTAAPNDYFVDLKPYLRDGDAPGVLDGLRPGDLASGALSGYDRLVVAGSAWDLIQENVAAKDAVKAWVAQGGRLFVTDDALQFLPDLGVVDAGAVDHYFGYAGYTNFVDLGHEYLTGVRGLARQTYEPVPLGYGIRGLNSPVWYVDAGKFQGSVIGVGGDGQSGTPVPDQVVFGSSALGEGEVAFLGAILPDPTVEFYHPYGLDGYATTYTGNQIFRNVLGWEEKFEAPPVISPETGTLRPLGGGNSNAAPTVDAGEEGGAGVPGPSALAALVALGVIALAMGGRRRNGGA